MLPSFTVSIEQNLWLNVSKKCATNCLIVFRSLFQMMFPFTGLSVVTLNCYALRKKKTTVFLPLTIALTIA